MKNEKNVRFGAEKFTLWRFFFCLCNFYVQFTKPGLFVLTARFHSSSRQNNSRTLTANILNSSCNVYQDSHTTGRHFQGRLDQNKPPDRTLIHKP